MFSICKRKACFQATGSGLLIGFLFLFLPAWAQQTASKVEPPRNVDIDFNPEISNPAFPLGKGPVVMVDEAHINFHTSVGTYYPFARFLERDGYIIKRGREPISTELLEACKIYVISDAQPPEKKGDPPTFSNEEIMLLNTWVHAGGALFLITDHMPDPGAIAVLAESFGIEVNNGYVLNGPPPGKAEPTLFKKADGTLQDHFMTRGPSSSGSQQTIATFTGSAFRAGKDFQPILVFGPGTRSWMPKEYYKFLPDTPNIDVEGWYQGGIQEYGEGRLAVFSEAAMFTAQAFNNGRVKFGMNHPWGKDNAQLLLNIMHWLSGQ